MKRTIKIIFKSFILFAALFIMFTTFKSNQAEENNNIKVFYYQDACPGFDVYVTGGGTGEAWVRATKDGGSSTPDKETFGRTRCINLGGPGFGPGTYRVDSWDYTGTGATYPIYYTGQGSVVVYVNIDRAY